MSAEAKKPAGRKVLVAGADNELGFVTVRHLIEQGHTVTALVRNEKAAGRIGALGATVQQAASLNPARLSQLLDESQPAILLNLWPQTANTLLHDGQEWRGYDRLLPSTTRLLVEALKGRPDILLVHCSYGFLYGPNALEADEDQPLTPPASDPIFRSAIQAEQIVAESGVPLCLLRLGYLYGPQSEDLKKYIQSFRLNRPYFAGPETNLQSWLHFEDAAVALGKVVAAAPKGQIFNIADDQPASFADFMDYFALRSGFNRPGHIPPRFWPFVQLIIARQHAELVEQSSTINSTRFRQQFGWQPTYPSYRQGLVQTIESWGRQVYR